MHRNRKGGAEGGDVLHSACICLISETPSGTERFTASAAVAAEPGGPAYSFIHGGAHFCVTVGETVRVSRKGDFFYELVLDPREETEICIRTPYGEIGARVRVHDLQCVQAGEKFSFECVYSLDFSGDRQRHRLRFSARPQSARGKEMV